MNLTAFSAPSRRLDSLDLLRFFAAGAVLFYHFYFIGPLQGFWPKSIFIPVAHWGDLGVDLFFVISGFVITLTSENRNTGAFLKARTIRLFPAFLVCSGITALMAIMLPGINGTDIFIRWLASQMFYPRVFGIEPLSSVYWTLAIEIHFYGLVTLLLAIGVWKRHNDLIIWSWLISSFIIQYFGGPAWLAKTLITEYAGHFCAGIVLYRLHAGQPPRFATAALLIACALISKHVQHIDEWLGGSYQEFFSPMSIVLAAPGLLTLVMLAAKAPPLPSRLALAAPVLGAMSYPFYLIHADLGFWSHAIFERKLFELFPELTRWVSYPAMAFGAIALSLLFSWLVATRIEPQLQLQLKKRLLSINPLRHSPSGHEGRRGPLDVTPSAKSGLTPRTAIIRSPHAIIRPHAHRADAPCACRPGRLKL